MSTNEARSVVRRRYQEELDRALAEAAADRAARLDLAQLRIQSHADFLEDTEAYILESVTA